MKARIKFGHLALFILLVPLVMASTQITEPATDELAFFTGSAERIRIDSSGNIGIGTSEPTTEFEIFDASGSSILTVESGSGASNAYLATNNSDQIFYFGTAGDTSDGFKIRDGSAGADRLFIDTSGNIGINTTTPGGKLNIHQGILNMSYGTVDGSGVSAIVFDRTAHASISKAIDIRAYFDTSGPEGISIYDRTDGENIAFFTESGNVGIGTSAPGQALHVIGSINATGTIYGDGSGITGVIASSTAWNRSGSTVFQAQIADSVGIGSTSVPKLTGWADPWLTVASDNVGISLVDTNNADKARYLANGAGNFYIGQFDDDGANAETQFFIADGGNIGIGTLLPAGNFHVVTTNDASTNDFLFEGPQAQMIINGSSTSSNRNAILTINVENMNNGAPQLRFAHNGDTNWTIQSLSNSGKLLFTGSSTTMALTQEGNVGIGTIEPNATLHINSTKVNHNVLVLQGRTPSSGNYQQLLFRDQTYGENSTAIRSYKSGPNDYELSFLTITNGNADLQERMRIDDEGNVGIGTTTPTQELDVAGDINLSSGTATIYVSELRTSRSDQDIYVRADLGGDLWLGEYGDTFVKIQGSGNRMGVGTTSPTATLHVEEDNSNGAGEYGQYVHTDADQQEQALLFVHSENTSSDHGAEGNEGEGAAVVIQADANINPLVIQSTTDTSQNNHLLRMRGANGGSYFKNYHRTGVSTSAVEISQGAGRGGVCIVAGDDSTNYFNDFVFFTYNQPPTVIVTDNVGGSPPARTYTTSGSSNRVALASGSGYGVQTNCWFGDDG